MYMLVELRLLPKGKWLESVPYQATVDSQNLRNERDCLHKL